MVDEHAAPEALSDAVAARHQRGACVGPRCFFEDALFVCVAECADGKPTTGNSTAAM